MTILAPAAGAVVSAVPTVPASDAAPPPGVSAEQWAEARRALADHPQRDAELARIGEYLAFQSDVERFTRLRAHGKAPTPELTALARSLEARLPVRLARGEMHAGEAQLLKAAVLDATEPDARLRRAALTAWSAAEAARASASSRPDPREAAYITQQEALAAAWRQLPESERDPKQLEAQLEALRRKTFVDPAR